MFWSISAFSFYPTPSGIIPCHPHVTCPCLYIMIDDSVYVFVCVCVCSFRICHLPVKKSDGCMNYWQYSLVLWDISRTQSYFCRLHHILYYTSATLFLTTAICHYIFFQRISSSRWLHWACLPMQAHSLRRQSTIQISHVLDNSSPRRYVNLKD